MRKVLVLQHVAWENLGTLDPLLKKSGLRCRYINFHREPGATADINKYNGLVMLGGPMGVYECEKHTHLKTEFRLVEEAIKADVPILGICLGAQILAHVLGGEVRKHTEREMGWYQVHLTEAGLRDPLLNHFQQTENVFQSHGDTFDIPKSTEHLGWSKACPGQAFRYGDKVYGFQFHLEANQGYVTRWCSLPANQKFVSEKIAKDTEKYLSRSLDLSHQTFEKFIKLFGEFERKVALGSGHGKVE